MLNIRDRSYRLQDETVARQPGPNRDLAPVALLQSHEIRDDTAVLAGSGFGERVDDFQLDRVAFDEVRELLFERRHVQ